MRMIRSGKFAGKKIVLLEKEPKTKNDRTWCFWEEGNGFFEEIVYRSWPKIDFLSDNYSATLDINPYSYKMVRGIDFYSYCFNEISNQDNIEVVYGELSSVRKHSEGLTLVVNDQEYNFDHAIVFNSILNYDEQNDAEIKLMQHFQGWVIKTTEPVFDPGKASLMDFRVHQQYGTAFAYVLPLNGHSALVEYTLFTASLLQQHQYDEELKSYIRNYLKITEYTIEEKEFGIIPMTNKKFEFYKDSIFHIGAAGGQTKASSGYTFQFIQKQSQQIIDCLIRGHSLTVIKGTAKRFRFYDNTLLHILYQNKLPGKRVFTQLFQKNKPQQVLRFLDNESSLLEEVKIISSLPTWPFLKAALRQL